MDINRYDFKKSLLYQSLIKIDYTGIVDLKDTIGKIQGKIKSNGYTEMHQGKIGQGRIDITFNDPNAEPIFDINSLMSKENFIFHSADRCFELQINDAFIAIGISMEKGYIKFEEYLHQLLDIFGSIKDINTYITIKRIGLRKLDRIFLEKFEDKEKLFKDNIFPNFTRFGESNVSGEYTDNSVGEISNVNYIRFFSKGIIVLEQKEVSVTQFILDIDSYFNEKHPKLNECNNLDIETKDLMSAIKEGLIDLNDACFNIFLESCKEDLITFLCDESNSLEGVIL